MLLSKVLIVVMFITIVHGAREECGQSHTLVYDEWKRGAFTGNFFVLDTYLPNTEDDALSCKEYSRDEYRNYIKDTVPCTGNWCRNNEFRCQSGFIDRECYHVEHIIDVKNSLGPNGDPAKNIKGNYIMAYSRWNMELGKLCWEDVAAEKAEIYGTIFNRAKQAVSDCLLEEQGRPSHMDSETWIDGGAVVVLLLLGALFIIFLIYRRRQLPSPVVREDRDDLLDNEQLPEVEQLDEI